jgi:hypothetical protein
MIVFDRDYPDVMSGEIEGTQDFQFRALGVDRQIIDGLGGAVMAQKIVERDSLDCVPRSALPRNGMLIPIRKARDRCQLGHLWFGEVELLAAFGPHAP